MAVRIPNSIANRVVKNDFKKKTGQESQRSLLNVGYCKYAFCLSDTILDCNPNHLTDFEEYLELVDTAFFINTSCPPLLRPERQVDIIIHLNYSGGSQALVRNFFILFSHWPLHSGFTFKCYDKII